MADPIPGTSFADLVQDSIVRSRRAVEDYEAETARQRRLELLGLQPAGPTLNPLANIGTPSPSTAMVQYDQMRPPTEIERLSGIRIDGPREDLPDVATIGERIKRFGKGFVEQFNPFEGDISGRERLFRTLNVASMAVPAGWLLHATRLGVAFPALRAMAATARGRVALQAMDGMIVNGSLELVRSPEERGEHGVTWAVVGGAVGGAIGGKISNALMRRRNANLSQAIMAQLMDDSRFATGALDAAGDWAVIPSRNLDVAGGTPASVGVLTQRRLHANLEEAGIANQVIVGSRRRATKTLPEEMTLVAGLDPAQAYAIGRELGVDEIFTNKGLIRVAEGEFYPSSWSGARVGSSIKPTDPFLTFNSPKRKVALPFRSDMKPQPIASLWGRANPVERAVTENVDAAMTHKGPFKRMFDRWYDQDFRLTLKNWYSEVVNGFGGARTLDRVFTGKSSEHLPFGQSLYKAFELAKSRGASFTTGAFQHKLTSYDGAKVFTQQMSDGSTVSSFLDTLKFLGNGERKGQLQVYGALRRWHAMLKDGQEVPRFVKEQADQIKEMLDRADPEIIEAFDTWTKQRKFFYDTVGRDGDLYRHLDDEALEFLDDEDWVPLTRYGDRLDKIHDSVIPRGKNWENQISLKPKLYSLADVNDADQWFPWIEEDIRRMHTLARIRDQSDALQQLGEALLDPERAGIAATTRSLGVADETFVPLFEKVEDLPPPVDLWRAGGTAAEKAEAQRAALKFREATRAQSFAQANPDDARRLALEAGEEPMAIMDRIDMKVEEATDLYNTHTLPSLKDKMKAARAAQRRRKALNQAPVGPTGNQVVDGLPENLVQKLPDGSFQFNVWVGGQQHTWRTRSKEMINMLRTLGPDDVKPIAKLLGTPAALMRTGTTMSTDFMGRNVFRDAMFSFVNVGLHPLAWARGMASVLRQDEWFKSWVNQGGLRSSMAATNFDELSRNIRNMQLDNTQRLRNVIKHPLHALSAIGDAMESFSRVGIYRREVGRQLRLGGFDPKGMSMEDIARHVGSNTIQTAVQLSRDGVTDFAMHGASGVSKYLRYLMAFWNPSLQGLDTMVRHAKADPRGVFARGSLLTAASAALYMVNRNDEEYRTKLPDWEKQLFWHVRRPEGMFGDDADDPSDDRWMRIAKPFEYGMMFSSIPEAFFQYLDENDPQELDRVLTEIVASTAETVTPGLPDFNLLRPWMEWERNKRYLGGGMVKNPSLEGIDPELLGPGTATIWSRKFAELMNRGFHEGQPGQFDPQMLDHVFASYTGTLGRSAFENSSKLVDWALNMRRDRSQDIRISGPTPEAIESFPFIGGMVSNPNVSQSLMDFYELSEWVENMATSADYLEDNLRIDDYVDYTLTGITRNHAIVKPLIQQYGAKIAEIRTKREEILSAPGLDGLTKRQVQHELNNLMHDLAVQALALSKELGFDPNQGPKDLMRRSISSITGMGGS